MKTISEMIGEAVKGIDRMTGGMTAASESHSAEDAEGMADDLFEAWQASQEISRCLMTAWAMARVAAATGEKNP